MIAYTDSSFDESKGIAGIGILLKDGVKERMYSNWIKCRTNNEAELFAIHIASILTEGKGVIYTDSQAAISYIKDEVKDKPRTTEQYINHKHCLFYAYQIRRTGITIEKIKAHQNKFEVHQLGNNLADLLARTGRAKAHHF